MHLSKLNFAEIFFVSGLILTLSTRLISNEILKNRYNNTNQGDPINLLPWSQSAFNVIGFLSVAFSIIFAYTITFWAGSIFLVLYFLSNIIASKLNLYRKLYRSGQFKRCISCKTFYDIEYYGIKEDGVNDRCVKCSNSNLRDTIEDIKNRINH